MKQIVISEYFVDAGLHAEPDSENHSLFREGLAMRNAIAGDFESAGFAVLAPCAFRPSKKNKVQYYTCVIAPETADILARTCTEFLGPDCYSLNCDDEAIHLSSRKDQLAGVFEKSGVKTPHTRQWKDWPRERTPAVVKPADGCGSNGLHLIRLQTEWENLPRECQFGTIVQDYVSGRAASVAFLIGPQQTVAMQPTFQVLSEDGRFHYLGGELPIRTDLAARAIKLGRQAVDCVPGLAGYVGVDLILGDAADGSEDYAIEINPRLTTSYVGLRQLADFNIAQMMIDVFEGKPVAEPTWKPGRVRFYPDGRVDYDPTPGAVFG